MASTTFTVYLPYKESPIDHYVIRLEVTNTAGVNNTPPVLNTPPIINLTGPLAEPTNLPRYVNCAGTIKQGLVKEIRRYTFNNSVPGFDTFYFTSMNYSINEGDSQITSGTPATIITFQVNNQIMITKERAVKIPQVPVPSDPYDRQETYFARNPNKTPQIEIYDASGQVSFTVYGSWERALEAAREKIFTGEEVQIGTYTKYHSNGYVWKIQSYTNPTLSGESLLNGPYFEYHNNGNARVEANFLNNYLNGFYREYYYDGLVKCQGTLINGKLEGEYTQWDAIGNRQFKAYYINGTLNNSYVLDYS